MKTSGGQFFREGRMAKVGKNEDEPKLGPAQVHISYMCVCVRFFLCFVCACVSACALVGCSRLRDFVFLSHAFWFCRPVCRLLM